MAIRNRVLFWTVLLAFLMVGLAYAFWPRAVLVDIASVSKGSMSLTIDEEGETQLKDVFIVSAPVSGELDRITLEAGDRVSAGQTVLAVIRPSTAPSLDARTQQQLVASVQSAASAIDMAQASIDRLTSEHNLASQELDRQRVLHERGFASQTAFDRAISAVDSVQAQLQSAQAGLKMRRADLQMARSALMPRQGSVNSSETLELTSVTDGLVLHIDRESGGPVAQGATLMEIGNADDLEVVVDLLSEDAVAISLGDPVRISGWGGADLEGRVRLIEPFAFTKISALGIEEQRVNVIIDFDASGSSLGHGYRVDVAVVTWQGEDVLRVPMTALFKQGNDWKTYVVREHRAVLQTLTLGQTSGLYAQVIDGVSEDEQVIEHPSARIEDGRRVKDRIDN